MRFGNPRNILGGVGMSIPSFPSGFPGNRRAFRAEPTHSNSRRPIKDVLIGRQAIYDRTLQVRAYELLFRGGGLDLSRPDQADRATSRVLIDSFSVKAACTVQ